MIFIVLSSLCFSQILLESISWLYRLSYGFGISKYYSPTLQLANVTLTYAKDPSPMLHTASITSRFISIMSQIISSCVFVLQMFDCWKQSTNSKLNLTPFRRSLVNAHVHFAGNCVVYRQEFLVPVMFTVMHVFWTMSHDINDVRVHINQ
jgi:hypothetical protein